MITGTAALAVAPGMGMVLSDQSTNKHRVLHSAGSPWRLSPYLFILTALDQASQRLGQLKIGGAWVEPCAPWSVLEAAIHSVSTAAQLATFPLAPPLSFPSLASNQAGAWIPTPHPILEEATSRVASKSRRIKHPSELNARRLRAVSILFYLFSLLGPSF